MKHDGKTLDTRRFFVGGLIGFVLILSQAYAFAQQWRELRLRPVEWQGSFSPSHLVVPVQPIKPTPARKVVPPTYGVSTSPTPSVSDSCQFILDASQHIKQGYTLWVTASVRPTSSTVTCEAPKGLLYTHLGTGKSVPLYPQSPSVWQGALPVHIVAPIGYASLVLHTQANTSTGKTLASAKIEITSGGYTKQNIGLTKGMSQLSLSDQEATLIHSKRATSSATRHFKQLPPWQRPVKECISGAFGDLRYHNGKFSGSFHRGMDHLSGMGVPILAPAEGTVKLAQTLGFHGGTVLLDHGQGITTIYIHQSAILVKEGMHVSAGTPIGKVGDTGFATGPHLHWGVFVHGEPVNPIQWITPKSSLCGV
ncbi:MAG: M23 family metallopeptidase [Vampirovibrionales bacterium]